MIVIGLTGSIGMGKSTAAGQFAALGIKVCNADDIVHRLMAKGGAAVREIGWLFPGVVKAGAVDRKALGDIVFKDKEKLGVLEKVLHPLVVVEENRFIARQRCKGARIAVLEIPLLFETGAEKRCNLTVVTTAPPFLQKQRVMKRSGMTEQKFASILRSQMPDRQKRQYAYLVVQTGLGKAYSFKSIKLLVQDLEEAKL